MERLLAIMKTVCNKPGLYVGQARMPQVRAFLDGYAMATYDLTRDRIEQRYLLGFTRVWPR